MNLRWSGDTLLLVEFAHAIDPEINAQVVELANRLRRRIGQAIRDVVPGYCTVGIHIDPLQTDLTALERAIRDEAAQVERSSSHAPAHVIDIAVRYGGSDGPDLEKVAEWAGCTPAEVIERHAGRTYRVYMLGFVPGFAYMGKVDRSIAAPRHRVPRERVPAGSVGIAGEQTGVYPISTPGGWQLIGRTTAVMFDSARPQPSLVQPGDLVRFVPAGDA
jgi:KipI family sensor histidine kinase inhibitor